MRTLSFIHMHRTINRLADIMANEGLLCAKSNKIFEWIETPQGRLRDECHKQATLDREFYRNRGNK